MIKLFALRNTTENIQSHLLNLFHCQICLHEKYFAFIDHTMVLICCVELILFISCCVETEAFTKDGG